FGSVVLAVFTAARAPAFHFARVGDRDADSLIPRFENVFGRPGLDDVVVRIDFVLELGRHVDVDPERNRLRLPIPIRNRAPVLWAALRPLLALVLSDGVLALIVGSVRVGVGWPGIGAGDRAGSRR